MHSIRNDRRRFLRLSVITAAASAWAWALPGRQARAQEAAPVRQGPPRLRFAVIGLNHDHINGQVDAVMRGGGELRRFFAKEPDLAAGFAKRYPQAKLARSEQEILEDQSITAGASARRSPTSARRSASEVMRHGKDFMSDKPGMTTLAAAGRRPQGAGARRSGSTRSSTASGTRTSATVKAGELVKAGAIGKVIQTIGLGPHRMNPETRPAWFFEKARYGGILCDIASHQFDQFLFFTGSTRGRDRRLAGGQRAPSRVSRASRTSAT